MTATKEEIGLRVDALAPARSGDEPVAECLAAERDEYGRAVVGLPEERDAAREAVGALEAASR